MGVKLTWVRSTEKADGMFATIIIVLPSAFAGGTVHLSHGGLSVVYDCSKRSSYQTSVLSWYTDVTHEVKPITSGYRLALAYNVMHTTKSLRPALSSNEETVQSLREILRAWDEDGGETAPEKIVYLLAHKYSQANLVASALKGADAHKVAVLDMLAQEFDFHLGLATIVYTLEGTANDSDGYAANPRGRYGWSSDEECDGPRNRGVQNLSFAEISDSDVSIEDLVDLEGNAIAEVVSFDPETDTIPVELEEMIRDGPHDEQEYEGYMGNVRSEFSRTPK